MDNPALLKLAWLGYITPKTTKISAAIKIDKMSCFSRLFTPTDCGIINKLFWAVFPFLQMQLFFFLCLSGLNLEKHFIWGPVCRF